MSINMQTFNKDMTVYEVIQICPETAEVFQEFGMHCFGCAFARGETVAQAAAAHGNNPDELLNKLNECAVANA